MNNYFTQKYKNIMIIVPHQDDEILLTAGLIRSCVKNGIGVRVVMVTNGDCGCTDFSDGKARLEETLQGLEVLGLEGSQVTFLGYADTGMPNKDSFLYTLYHEKDEQRIHPSHCSRETYGLKSKPEFHYEKHGIHAPYCKESVMQDLKEVVENYKPDCVVTTSVQDVHGDHSGLFFFVRDVLKKSYPASLKLENAEMPDLYVGMVHSELGDENWPEDGDRYTDFTSNPLGKVRAYVPEQICTGINEVLKKELSWENRIIVNVPEEMQSKTPFENLKACALAKHVTALKPDAVDFLYQFIKKEELFWKVDYNACIYPVEPWSITETEFDLKNTYRNETTFALSNGYIGTRGTFEESYPFSVEEGLEGNFINGFYESEDIRYGEWNFGFPLTSQSLLNLPNLKTLKLELKEGNEETYESFDLRQGTIVEYSRRLHMDQGIVERNVTWESPSGKRIKVCIKRFTSFAHKNLMAMSYEVTPLNFDGVIKIHSELDANVENHTRKTNPLVDYGPFGKRLFADKLENKNGVQFYQGTTKHSKLTMACGSTCEADGADAAIQESTDPENDKAVTTYIFNVRKELSIELHKYIIYTSELDIEKDALQNFVKNKLQKSTQIGYAALEAQQQEDMRKFWDGADVTIKGDDALQQGIRFNLFHIMQAAGRDGRTGMGAKGLSGEGYEGHYFWDTEMYVLPVFAYTDPALAKSLLDYRYEKLNDARDRAKVLGHQRGALYPWRTINGQEASTYYPLGTAQYHINADIAYAFKLYVDVADDYAYLEERAAEVFIETARVWADVGCFAESKGNKYCICAVTGPDEYNAIVDNNFYTNLMARENIRDAVWALATIYEKNPSACEQLVNRLEVTREEVSYWQRIVDNMYFPFDEKRQIYPLDDGFMQRKPWDETKIPVEKRHLLYENYHPLFIFRQRMSKQADAILGILLHSNYFTEEELRRNYDFYQEVTLHHSSLSTCIFGILADQIGYKEEAYRYFSQSARMDLDDYHNNFYAGIHAANMAGTWQGIVFGFAGVRTNKGVLEFKPSIPDSWESYSFKMNYKGARLLIELNQGKTNAESGACSFRIMLENDTPVIFYVGEKEINLTKKGNTYAENV